MTGLGDRRGWNTACKQGLVIMLNYKASNQHFLSKYLLALRHIENSPIITLKFSVGSLPRVASNQAFKHYAVKTTAH